MTCGRFRSLTTRRGSSTVELALLIPLLILLLFGIIEIGFVVKNRTELGQAAREGARLAAVGIDAQGIDAGIHASLQTIHADSLNRTYQFRTWNPGANSWTNWQALGSTGSSNNAPRGAHLRIHLECQHQLLIPGLMGPIFSANSDGEIALAATHVMMRE